MSDIDPTDATMAPDLTPARTQTKAEAALADLEAWWLKHIVTSPIARAPALLQDVTLAKRELAAFLKFADAAD